MTVDIKRLLEILEVTPEVRREKIGILRKAITDGTYVINADDIASKLLKELLLVQALARSGDGYRGPHWTGNSLDGKTIR